jgi:hypothetical protein
MNTMIDGYEVKSPIVCGDIPDFFNVMTNSVDKLPELLVRNCVLKDGVPVGDKMDNIPIPTVIKLFTAVIKEAGMDVSGNA